MAIKEETVIIKWHHISRKHYESLGYIWSGQYKEFEVLTKHLSSGASIKITAICDNCYKERVIQFCEYKPLCHKCSCIEREKNLNTREKRSKTLKLLLSDPEYLKEKRPSAFKSGHEHWNWNPNISDEDRIKRRAGVKEWSIAVKKRDKYVCQVCNIKDVHMESHHFYSYNNTPERRLDITNGVCLCKQCHNDFHNKYGRGNNTKYQFIEYIFLKFQRYN